MPASAPAPPPAPAPGPARPERASTGSTPAGAAPVKITRTAPSPEQAETQAEPKQIAPKPQIEQLTALFRSGRLDEALEAGQAMAREFPATMAGWNIAGAAARALGNASLAEENFQALEALSPTFAGAPYNLGLVHEDKGELAKAEAAYLRAIEADPSLAQARNNLGVHLPAQRRLDEALDHLEKACALRPDMAELHNSHGNALKLAERYTEAGAAYRQALTVKPGYAKARYNLGVLEQEHGDPERAIELFKSVVMKAPDHALARASLISLLAQLNDWDGLAEHAGMIEYLGVTTQAVPPFPLLGLEDNAARQLARARNWATARLGKVQAMPPIAARPAARPERLRIGYYSADYYNHPMMQLFTGPFRLHDRSRFEVHGFNVGSNRQDEGRRKGEALVDHFHDMHGWSDQAIVDAIRDAQIDILIDHDGYTIESRTRPLAMRPGPIQINMQGYPGTLGADCYDYIVCDPVVIPQPQRAHCDEKLIQLPHTYFATDDSIEIDPNAGTRTDHGLPEGATVLSCFNNSWKITQREFAIWMRVLARHDQCVLWFKRVHKTNEANLRCAAERHGIDPSRLIFSTRVPLAQHLARHAHADLQLDTFACGSHTTAVDALWAGLPIVTKLGEQFSARVASSLLAAIGLDELVTHTDAEYEELINTLVENPAKIAALKSKLAANRTTHPLFDSAGYTRHFEAALDLVYEKWRVGEAPADIIIPA